jgi:hypothetical protein
MNDDLNTKITLLHQKSFDSVADIISVVVGYTANADERRGHAIHFMLFDILRYPDGCCMMHWKAQCRMSKVVAWSS